MCVCVCVLVLEIHGMFGFLEVLVAFLSNQSVGLWFWCYMPRKGVPRKEGC